MRIISLIYVTLALAMSCEAAAKVSKCPRDYAGLTLRIEMLDSQFTQGQPIPVTVALHNGSADTIRLPPYMIPTYYWLDFEIHGPTGQRIPWMGTEFKIIEDGTRIKLDPGYFWGRRFEDLRDSYSLSAPGQYQIRAIYGVSPLGKCSRGSIVSDSVSFEVK